MQRLGIAIGAWLAAFGGCGNSSTPPVGEGSSSAASTMTAASTSAATSPMTATSSTTMPGETTQHSSASTSADETADPTTTGEPACSKNVVLMGYWPPTNEMLRPWSQNPLQNTRAWIGADWEGFGYDVYAFFPEFPPDGDPSNDPIGSPGSVGSDEFELQVDYQATSEDFWRIVDELRPIVLITNSRGGGIGWELEAIEGGHGMGNPGDPSMDWSSDGYGMETRPTMGSVDPRTWDAISTYRQGTTLASQLPLDEIFDAAFALGIASVEIDEDGTSGNYLSGFMGLHGVYYNQIAPHNVAAGHIHVGNGLPVETASTLIEQTLRVVLEVHPADAVGCSTRT
ncbi:hypothetical protein [Paraliomyxa miuraensis]|uniref:hypothetical protein n=1 Tax=Paraliomyxa miuraensis TaxID=376150 RepID=UPI0022501FEA|nr:hypothetical protein [Paraliomyxa miuraensis]MCX4240786.1 hypothetical protein [Paraliomyxa miuraensis]